MRRAAIGQLPAPLRQHVRDGFNTVYREGACALWTDSRGEARTSSNELLAELGGMLRAGRYDEGEAEAAAYGAGRDLGLAARRRREGAA